MANFSTNMDRAVEAAIRYEALSGKPRGYRRLNLVMDLTAADGENGNKPLDWTRLLAADDANFMHDIGGISRHIDRETGELTGCFVPRFTKRSKALAA